ncbi:hypothetical protein BMR1_03g01760 [Babesia microti strain RI]|uniref:Uncharacterized protein n=1 Tax=Babesia microti (strain RI) TaxID=1133968 RepID=A0A0K3ATS8_BABMR|nr:hypothetical protein BMR1_03g01760 [Babesia microti strain RI]CTQ40951.1 hypothetical protein BMR1_03g01760 [Babesia microti strain RI]|eukprot:XP_012648962.1 hypothetical protein BMR1_03g01760 [Babesia microti strain RI]
MVCVLMIHTFKLDVVVGRLYVKLYSACRGTPECYRDRSLVFGVGNFCKLLTTSLPAVHVGVSHA